MSPSSSLLSSLRSHRNISMLTVFYGYLFMVLLAFINNNHYVTNAQQMRPTKTSDITVLAGQTVKADCNVSVPNGVNVAYSWERPIGYVISRDRVLLLKDVDLSKKGTYFCRAKITGANGMSTTHMAQVNVRLRTTTFSQGASSANILLTPEPNRPPNTFQITAGQPHFQRCLAPTIPGAQVLWIRNPPGSPYGTGDTFYMANAQPGDSGTYTCIVRAPNGQEQRRDLIIQVTGGGGNPNPPPPPIPNPGRPSGNFLVVVRKTPATPLINQPLELICSTQPNYPGVTYQWIVDGREEPGQRSERYSFNPFSKNDFNKDIKCRATYNGQSVVGDGTIKPVFYSGLEIALSPPPGQQFVVKIGDTRELHCEVSGGVRKPDGSRYRGRDVTWFFEGVPIVGMSDPRLGVDRIDRLMVSILSLRNIQMKHEGKYECRLGRETKMALVLILGGTSGRLSVAPQVQTIVPRDFAELHCRVEGLNNVQNTQLKWYYLGDRNDSSPQNRRPLQQGWSVSNSPATKESSFINVMDGQSIHNGYYLCQEPGGKTAIGRVIINQPLTLTVTPAEIRVRPNANGEFRCIASGPVTNGRLMWRLQNGQPITSDFRITVNQDGPTTSRLSIRNINMADNGKVLECYLNTATARGTIYVENLCAGPNTFRCANGVDCIDIAKRCDGKRDCNDGSDEDAKYCRACDPLDAQCGLMNNRQPRNQRYSRSWTCDGEDDCGNGFDENNCKYQGTQCGGTQYQCQGGGSSPPVIPMAFVCDSQRDCPNNDDESNCRAPTIMRSNSQTKFDFRRGSTVTLTCTAMGKPLPKVIWRFNWRCLVDKNRMMESYEVRNCNEVVSTLTIRNAEPGDAGIYNCEAISANKRTVSQDYMVTYNPN